MEVDGAGSFFDVAIPREVIASQPVHEVAFIGTDGVFT